MKLIIELNANEIAGADERGLLKALAEIEAGKEAPEKKEASEAHKEASPAETGKAAFEATTVPVETAIPEVMPQTETVPSSVLPISQMAYTQNDLALAASQLMDAGKQQELIALLARFNVASLVELSAEQYGAFAAELRNMGAKI